MGCRFLLVPGIRWRCMSLRQSSRPRTERIDPDDYSASGLFQAGAGIGCYKGSM